MAIIDNTKRDIGDRVTVKITCKDADGAIADPTGLTFRVLDNTGTEVHTWVHGTDPEVVKDGVGLYRSSFDLTAAGDWYYRWEATGTVTAAEERKVVVKASAFS